MTGRRAGRGPQVVALGGGHGLAASLQALRQLTSRLTAVVTVADDGGSSGRLRAELGQLPPGDLRMALAALARDDEWGATWTTLLQHRFGGDGPLAGHAVGNLVLAGLTECTGGDTVRALDLAARLLGAVGRVLPMSASPLVIVAQVAGLDPDDAAATREVVGQVAVASTAGRVTSVQLRPQDPPACPESVQAVLEADWVVLGPGSWFTSVLPHLMVPDLRDALVATPARRAVCLNLAEQAGETDGLTPQDHLQVLLAHCPDLQGRRRRRRRGRRRRRRRAEACCRGRRRPARPRSRRAGRRHAAALPGPPRRRLRRRDGVTPCNR